MSRLGWMGTLRAGTALGILIVATAQANAGGFAIREQSTYGQGTSFAGVAAGGALSSMFWNPATMTQFQGIVNRKRRCRRSFLKSVRRHSRQHARRTPLVFGGVSNSGEMALVPNGYTSYQTKPEPLAGLGDQRAVWIVRQLSGTLGGPELCRRHDCENLQRNIPASHIASTIGSASASACRFNTRRLRFGLIRAANPGIPATSWTAKAGASARRRALRSRRRRTRRSDLVGVRRSIRTSMGTLLLPPARVNVPSQRRARSSTTLNLPDIVSPWHSPPA